MIILNELPSEMMFLHSQLPYEAVAQHSEQLSISDVSLFDLDFVADIPLDDFQGSDFADAFHIDGALSLFDELASSEKEGADLIPFELDFSQPCEVNLKEVISENESSDCSLELSSLVDAPVVEFECSHDLDAKSEPQLCSKALSFKISGVSLPRIAGYSECLEVAEQAKVDLTTDVVVSPTRASKRPRSQVEEVSHDPSACWVCQSHTSDSRKDALHRYLVKRVKRQQSGGRHRYAARSAVASSRNRQKGRFVEAVQWVSLSC